MNSTTFVMTHNDKMTLINHAKNTFLPSMWFAVYRFASTEFLFGSRVKATRWLLDTKFAGSTATQTFANVTPMQTAYRIDDGYEWFFKTF